MISSISKVGNLTIFSDIIAFVDFSLSKGVGSYNKIVSVAIIGKV